MEVDIKLLVKTYPNNIVTDIYNNIVDSCITCRTNLIYHIIKYRITNEDKTFIVEELENELAIINAITAKRTVRAALRRKLYNYVSPVTTIND